MSVYWGVIMIKNAVFARGLKAALFLCLLLCLALALSGCMTGGDSQKKDVIRIAMVPKIVGISYFDKCAEGARLAAEKYGMELIYKGPTTADAASQVNIVQDLIYNDIDVIAIAPIDPDAVEPILKEARAKGIKIVTFDADSTPEGRDVFVNQVDGEVFGKHIVDNVAKLIGEDGSYAILTASMTADNQNQWLNAMTVYQQLTYPKLNLVTIIPTDEDQQKAYVNTRNLIQAYPDLECILALSTEAGPGAAQAFKALGIKGDVKLYSLALPNDMRQYIKSGYAQMGTLWNPYYLGGLTVEVIENLMQGEPIHDGDILGGIGPIQYDEVTGTVIMGEPVDFDIDNIDDYDF